MRALLFRGVLVCGLTACSLFVSLDDGPLPVSVDASDAALREEAAVIPDAEPLVPDAAPSDAGAYTTDADLCPLTDLLAGKGAMDAPSAWTSIEYADISASATEGRNGGNGMKLCNTDTRLATLGLSTDYRIDNPRGIFYVQAWLKKAPGIQKRKTLFTGRIETSAGYSELPVTNALLSETYACFSARGDVTSGLKLYPVISNYDPSGAVVTPECIYVDDVRMYQVPDGGTLPASCRCP
jgi:hypothetical protein